MFEEEQQEGVSAESVEPIPSWVIDLLRLESNSEGSSVSILLDLSITSDSEAISNLEAESLAMQFGSASAVADRLSRIVEAHKVLKNRLDIFSAESAGIWEDLRLLHRRLYPFLPDHVTKDSLRIEQELVAAEPAVFTPRIPRSLLRRVHGAWLSIEQDRSESISGSILLISRLWDLLETAPSERFTLDPYDLSLKNMELLLAERRKLIDFQQQRFRELYEMHLQELKRLMSALRMNPRQQSHVLSGIDEYTAEGLQQLSRHLAVLQPKLELTTALIGSIDARISLIQKMREFEVSASDPARLFRSSFQLLQEEKFRKTALPNLLALESKLKGQLTEYLRRYREDFICEESGRELRPFAEVLEEEISGRYLNDSIFGFDQAKQRKERSERHVGDTSAPRYVASSKCTTRKIASIGSSSAKSPSIATSAIPQRRSASRLDK